MLHLLLIDYCSLQDYSWSEEFVKFKNVIRVMKIPSHFEIVSVTRHVMFHTVFTI